MFADGVPDRIVSLMGFDTWIAKAKRRLASRIGVVATRLRGLGRPGELVWLLIGLLALVAWLWILWRGSIHHR